MSLALKIMRFLIGLFASFLTVSNAYIFNWVDLGTGATGMEIAVKNCPPTAAEALMRDSGYSISNCDETILRMYYNENGCCYNFIAECNLIEREWWKKADVFKEKPLCPYRKKIFIMEHRRLRKRFTKRMRRIIGGKK